MALEAPDASEAADTISEAAEERRGNERFRRRAAVAIGVLAMLLAIAGLGGGNATKEMLNANIQASDTYAFYQAKNIRQTSNQLSADELQAMLLAQPSLAPEAQAQIRQRIQQYEQRRDRAARQDPNFDFAEALLQIGIVLGSVSIVATQRWLLGLGIALGG